jgi:glutathione peroxidase
LYEKYSKDLEIIAFPCNDFLSQEPWSSEEIQAYVTENFNVGFRLMEKVVCTSGKSVHPIFPFLTNAIPDSGFLTYFLGHNVKWNFTKFLCDSNGIPLKRFSPLENPLSFEDDIVNLISNGSNNASEGTSEL